MVVLINEAMATVDIQCSTCGQPAKFFQLASQQHACEQCTLNEIYTQEETYEDVVKKVTAKMQNIIKLRQKKALQ